MRFHRHRLTAFALAFGLLSLSAPAPAADEAKPAPDAQPAAAADSGFVPLFDGKTLNGWVVTNCKAAVEDGNLVILEGNGMLRADKVYGDFILELEWKPRKAEKWDSGIYFRAKPPRRGQPWPDRYQVNLLQNKEGELVGNKTVKPPGNAKGGEWNRMRLTAVGKTAELEVNGKHAWKVEDIANESGLIAIQVEVPGGGQFEFRNIRIKALTPPVPADAGNPRPQAPNPKEGGEREKGNAKTGSGDRFAGRKVLAADYSAGKKRIALVDAGGKVLWEHPIKDIHDAHLLDNGHVLFQTDWTHVVEADASGKKVWEYDAGKQNGNAGKKVEVHAFQRLPGGVTMIAESGPGRIIEVDREGKLLKEVRLKLDKPDAHRDTRNARKLENGHYLVAHEGDRKVREYDADGKVVWEHDAKTAVYSAVRLKNGNTLIGTGNGHSVIEVTPEGKVAWSVGENDLRGVKLAWVTQVARLENGNTVIVNCHAGPENPQVVEVTPGKKVAWSFKDFERFGNSTPVAQVVDEKTGG